MLTRKYHMLKSGILFVWNGSSIDSPAGAWSNTSMILPQSKKDAISTMTITTATTCVNMPCRQSVTITATWPPAKTKKSETASRTNMTSGNVATCRPSNSTDSGMPQKATKKRAPTAGKMPKLMSPATHARIPASTRTFRL